MKCGCFCFQRVDPVQGKLIVARIWKGEAEIFMYTSHVQASSVTNGSPSKVRPFCEEFDRTERYLLDLVQDTSLYLFSDKMIERVAFAKLPGYLGIDYRMNCCKAYVKVSPPIRPFHQGHVTGEISSLILWFTMNRWLIGFRIKVSEPKWHIEMIVSVMILRGTKNKEQNNNKTQLPWSSVESIKFYSKITLVSTGHESDVIKTLNSVSLVCTSQE